MYNERRDNFNFKSVILQFLFVALFIFVLMWLFPMKSDLKKAMNTEGTGTAQTTDLSMFYDQIFNNNVVAMKDAAKSYFTTPRLPKEVGDKVKLTLGEMLDKKIILPFVDSKGKKCDLDNSYVEITKHDDEFVMKVNLKCSDQENYLLVYMGCYDYCQTAICEKKKSDIKKPVIYPAKKVQPQKSTTVINNTINNTIKIKVVTPEPTPVQPEKKYLCVYQRTTDGTTTYGEWSAWKTTEIKASSTLQVQRGKKDVTKTTCKDVTTKDLTKPIYETKTVGVGKATATYCAAYKSTKTITYGGWQRIGYVALKTIPNDTATTKYVPVSNTTWICKSQCTAGVDHVYVMYKRTPSSSSTNTKCTSTKTVSYILTSNVKQIVGYQNKTEKQCSNTTNTIYVYRARTVNTTGSKVEYKKDVCGLTDKSWVFTGEKIEVK